MIHLPINLDTFGFVQREKKNGVTVKYKCGRDFLYYALHLLLPSQFNEQLNNPQQIDQKGLFGLAVSPAFAWTQIQFFKLPKLLREEALILQINRKEIHHFFGFLYAILFSRISYDEAVSLIEKSVNENKASGVDIALRFQGLEDHVLFVYGYDEENLYVFDTHKLPMINYEKITSDDRYVMKLSRSEVKKRWKRFSRVWELSKV